LFGDIVTDLGAAFQGGLGMAASANIHSSEPTRVALFEPVHGSAPPLAGKDIANPFAALLTAGMLLTHLGWPEEELRIERVVTRAIEENACTVDVGGKLGTRAAAAWVRERVAAEL
ncbi:MAG: isocitrate/isopropylmalate family dehydrogenase, partial [Minicystis sp.]